MKGIYDLMKKENNCAKIPLKNRNSHPKVYLNQKQKKILFIFFNNTILRDFQNKLNYENFSIKQIFHEIPNIANFFFNKMK